MLKKEFKEMKIINKNKKAYHDYFVLQELEAGIMLKGSEVKSIRNGQVNLKGSFCKIVKGEVFLFECHISKYSQQNQWDTYSETRDRKLLLSKKEIAKLFNELKLNQGYSIVPLSIYFNENNKCKLKIALVKGKKDYDKRHVEKEKDLKRKISEHL